MTVPSAISDLSTTPASNSPAGSETPSSTDDYLRTHAAFIKQTYDALVSSSTAWAGAAGGTANALTLTPSPAIAAYATGQVFRFLAASTNTGASTIAISGLAAIALQINGAACIGGEIVAGQWYEVLLSSVSVAQLKTTLAPNLTTAINFKRANVVATATTTPLWLPSNFNVQNWTGTPTITDFPAAPQAGAEREVYPAAGTIITNAGNISVQGNANYTVAAGDLLTIKAVTTSTFYVSIVRKDGFAVKAIPQTQFQSMIRLNTANGLGSTNTAIRRFTNLVTTLGTDIAYADSSVLGASFTINVSGNYAISYTDGFVTNASYGVTLNSAQLTTAFSGTTASTRLCGGDPMNNLSTNVSVTVYLSSGDVIRPHAAPGVVSAGTALFTITRVS